MNREYVLRICHAMKVGQRCTFAKSAIDKFFPADWTMWDTPKERLLSNLMGSAWGCYTVEEGVYGDQVGYVIARHEESGKRVYVDPDRRHLFTQLPDGSYVPLGEPT